MNANFVGMDGWDRPVYKCEDGVHIKDVNPRGGFNPELCTCANNDPDGEPDTRVNEEITLLPSRVVW